MTERGSLTKLLSVVGAGRSGTTVLASILNEIDGFASAGELRRLWEIGVGEERPCGCGEIPVRCPVWSPVVARTLAAAEAGSPGDGLRQIVTAQHEVASARHRLRVLRSVNGGHQDWAALQRVRATMGLACDVFTQTTGARVMVDTSKRAEDAAVLGALDNAEHYVVHMVRDPRAVVHSWRRPKRFFAAGTTRTMGTRGLPSTVRRWIENCLGAEMLLREVPRTRWTRVRYEDFSRSPRAVVGEILALLGEHGEAPFEDHDTVLLHGNHIVAGNPSRFTTGSVTIRADDEWRQRMRPRDQHMIEVATMPLMVRYGYLGGSRGSAGDVAAQGHVP